MKHDWEYKKLGEVAEIIGGSTPKTNVPEYWDGDYFWVTPAELKGDRFIKSTARTITDLAVNSTNLSLLPKGTVLLSSRAPIGKVAITEVPMYCNQGFKNIVCGNKLNNNYVYWLLYGKTEYLNSLGVGATFKEISKKIVENISIPVPPLPTQQAIVSELDTLSGIIAECKETLKDYDALEQSIFYDMFGDPVKNEKGWEVKKLGECFKVTSSKRIYMEELTDCGIPFLKVADINNLINEKCTPTSFISNDKYQELKSNGHVPSPNDLLVTARGTIGKVYIIQENDAFYFQDGMITWLKQGRYKIEPKYIKDLFQVPNFLEYLGQFSNNSTVAFLSIAKLATVNIPIPPLPLQQSFATKIEAIEQMKAETREALQEAETLLQARMDYWFN